MSVAGDRLIRAAREASAIANGMAPVPGMRDMRTGAAYQREQSYATAADYAVLAGPASLDTPTKVLDAHCAKLRSEARIAEANLATAQAMFDGAVARLNAFLAEMDKR